MLIYSRVHDYHYSDFELELHGNVKYFIHVCYWKDGEYLVNIYDGDYECIAILSNYIFYHDRVNWDDLYVKEGEFYYEFEDVKSYIKYEDEIETIAYELLPDLLCHDNDEYNKI